MVRQIIETSLNSAITYLSESVRRGLLHVREHVRVRIQHQKPTDKQPNREYRRLQRSVERWQRDHWKRVSAASRRRRNVTPQCTNPVG